MRKYVQEKRERETEQTKSIEGKRHKIIGDERKIKRQRNRQQKNADKETRGMEVDVGIESKQLRSSNQIPNKNRERKDR